MEFEEFFRKATTYGPYPYQARLARAHRLPKLLIAPTGAGKTEAAILAAWLWRRLRHPDSAVRSATPRRLVYCLPMRTLVEQTHKRVQCWLAKLGLSERIGVSILMGGEEPDEWRLYPEKERILIGTQDMLISRALNRGYGASPFRWPQEFGLLNNDCLWVLDEVQLMANGLPTSTQLQGLRQTMGVYGACHTLWMSATVLPEWLGTVDFPAPSGDEVVRLEEDDFKFPDLARRRSAHKILRRLDISAKNGAYDAGQVAQKVRELHKEGSLTLVVVNTVSRAQEFYDRLKRLKPRAELVLVHSRFRHADRQAKNKRVTASKDEDTPGRIVVATQAIEAGVDISARTLVTELAPWASSVQRFGRCNRKGEYTDSTIHWIDLSEKDAAPYDAEELAAAGQCLDELEGQSVAPAHLPEFKERVTHQAVLRRRDLLGLFDTTADLSGSYLDVSRYVRGIDETDVQVFWRAWAGATPPENAPAPTRDEICSVPIGGIKDFLGARAARAKAKDEQGEDAGRGEGSGEEAPVGAVARRQAWRWDHLFGKWERVSGNQIHPGQTLLLRASDGGYTTERGWNPKSTAPVNEAPPPAGTRPQDKMSADPTNVDQKKWVLLREHSLHVRDEARRLLDALPELALSSDVRNAVLVAAHYHDWGKAHPVFQETLLSNLRPDEEGQRKGEQWAKRGQSARPAKKHGRPYFRHEVASAIGLLSSNATPDGWTCDLAAYLAAAHHGKARLGLRSLPRARDQDPRYYPYLLGFRMPDDSVDGNNWRLENALPSADLGDGVVTPGLVIDMSIARMGVSEGGERSWLDRMLALRDSDRLSPFRLAYLEALVRAADARASKAEQREGGDNHD